MFFNPLFAFSTVLFCSLSVLLVAFQGFSSQQLGKIGPVDLYLPS